MVRIVPALMIVLAAACSPGRIGRPPDPDAASPDRVVESLDGRWRLHVRRLSVAGPAVPEGPSRLDLQATIDLRSEDRLLAERDPVLGVRVESGVDHEASTPHEFVIGSARGDLRIKGLDVGGAAEVLARLDLVCHVLTVHSWKPHVFGDLGPVRRDGLVADPFVFTVTGERHNVWVAASRLDMPPDAVEADDLSRLLSHRWAAESAVVHDAAGRRLHGWGGSGTDGGTVIGYGAPINETPFEIAYPVSVEVQVPHRYDMATARFRIEGLRLPAAER